MNPHTDDRRRPRRSPDQVATDDRTAYERYEDDARIATRPRAEARRQAFYAQRTR